MKEFMRRYMNGENIPKGKDFFSLMCGVAVFGGIFGMIYEVMFYLLNDGGICRRGTCFGPWIEIYGIGGLAIYFMTKKLRKKPFLVLLVAGTVCGILEYIAGYAIYEIFDGRRGWNYNVEILSFGGEFTNGFVCVRSVLFFAASGVFLTYVAIPLLIILMQKAKKAFSIIAITLAMLFLADVVYNDVIVSIFDTYSAGDYYKQSTFYIKYNEDWLIERDE